jgi:hypothetical protein
MPARLQVDQQLAELGEQDAVRLSLDDDGVCPIEFEDGRRGFVYVPPTDNLVVLCVSVAPVLLDERGALFGHLLQMNYLDDETQGAALCVDADETEIFLRYSLPAGRLDHDGIGRLLGALDERASALGAHLSDWQRERSRATGRKDEDDAAEQFDQMTRPDPRHFV